MQVSAARFSILCRPGVFIVYLSTCKADEGKCAGNALHRQNKKHLRRQSTAMSNKFATCCFGLLTAIGLVLTTSIACAQTVTGSIRGTVTDASGAVVIDAKVTAKNLSTGVTTTAATDRSGDYNLQSLPIGTYVVSAE